MFKSGVAVVASVLIALGGYTLIYLLITWLVPVSVYIFVALLGIYTGLSLCLFVLPLIPGAIDSLSNKPQEEGGNVNPNFGFFVALEQGRVVIIQRGKKFMFALMDFANHMWLGERHNSLTKRRPAFWEVVNSGVVHEESKGVVQDTVYHDTHPIPFPVKDKGDVLRRWWWVLYSPLSIHLWVWKRWVYSTTGGVFTGIYPFQTVRTHKMAYMKKVLNPDGSWKLEPTKNTSNHYRVGEFQVLVTIAKAETQDSIELNVTISLILRVFNPFIAAYKTDGDLIGRILSIVSDEVGAYVRTKARNEVMNAKSPDEARALAKAIFNLGIRPTDENAPMPPLCEIGIETSRAQIEDISLVDEGMATALGAKSIALVTQEADEILAKGLAAYPKALLDATSGNPNAVKMAEIAAGVEMAKALAGSQNPGVMVTLGGHNSDQTAAIEAAVLQTLRQIERKV